MQRTVTSGNVLTFRVQAAPRSRVRALLQVTIRRVIVVKVRSHLVWRTRTIVLYRKALQGGTNARGQFVGGVRVAYNPAKRVRALLSATMGVACGMSTRTAWVTIAPRPAVRLPLALSATPRVVVSGHALTMTVRTAPRAHVVAVLRVLATKVSYTVRAGRRVRHTRTVVLYRKALSGMANARGRYIGRARIAYAPAKRVRLALAVTVRATGATANRTTWVTLAPAAHRR